MSGTGAAQSEADAWRGRPSPSSPALTPVRWIPVIAAPTLAGAFAFSIYLATAAPGAWWGDGLELSVAAEVLGIPHPPGYPLYTILGHLLLRFAEGADPGRAMTLFSAALCAVGAALAGGLAYALLRGAGRDDEGRELPSPVERGPAALTALGTTLIVAFSRTVWEHGTFAEVYPLSFVLVCAMTLVAVWPEARNQTPGLARVLMLGVLAGLSALNHYSAVAAAPLVVAAVASWGRRRENAGGHVGALVATGAIFLLGYLWIPYRAAANPPLNFGNPDSLGGLLWMLKGGQYGDLQALRAGNPGVWAAGAQRWLAWWGGQLIGPGHDAVTPSLGGLAVAGAVGGNVLLALRRPVWGWGALAMIAATLGFGMFYLIPDIEGYFLPAIPAAVLGYAELIRRATERAGTPHGRLMVTASVGVAAVLLGLGLLRLHLREVNKNWDRGPERWAGNVLEALPEDALVLTRQGADSEIYALWYAQMVEKRRPDVSVFGAGFIFSGWYASYFEHDSRPEIPIFVTDRPPGTKAEYDVALVGGVIVPNLRERRVFVTYRDPILEEHFAPRPVAELLPQQYYARTSYTLNPPGPVLYELQRNLQIEPLAETRLEEMYGSAG